MSDSVFRNQTSPAVFRCFAIARACGLLSVALALFGCTKQATPPPVAPAVAPAEASRPQPSEATSRLYLQAHLHSLPAYDLRSPVRPGAAIDFVDVACTANNRGARTRARCQARTKPPEPPKDVDSCFVVRRRAPTRAELDALEDAWRRHATASTFERPLKMGSVMSLPSPLPRPTSGDTPSMMRVRFEVFGKRERTKGGGCDNAPRDVGCLPVTVGTGVFVRGEKHREIRVAAPPFPAIYDQRVFPNNGASAHRFQFLRRPYGDGPIDPEPRLALAPSHMKNAAGYEAELARLRAFPRRDYPPDIQAAVLINIATLHILLERREAALAAIRGLRAFAASHSLDRKLLHLDITMLQLQRYETADWTPTRPCAGAG